MGFTIEKIKRLTADNLSKPKTDISFSEKEIYEACKIQVKAYHYNFDEGYKGIYELLESEFCDKSTALIFYWLNSPLFYLNNPDSNRTIHEDGAKLKKYIEDRITRKDYKEILQFVPIYFIEGPMHMQEDLLKKEPYLKEIPEELFLPAGMNYNTTGTCNKINKYLDLSGIKTLYWFDPVDCSDVKKIQGDETLTHLNILFNGYIRTKPKIGTISNLLHLKNLKTLRMDFYVRFRELGKLTELRHLEQLKINVEKEDYSMFSSLSNVKSLEFTSSVATDLTTIEDMIQLEELVITGCANLTDISGIKNLKNLKTLKIKLSKKLKKLDGIFETNINTLIFSEVLMPSNSFKGLEKMQLKILQLDCKNLKNIDFLPVNTLKELNLYRLQSNDELSKKIKTLHRSNFEIIERDWNNAL